jgi:hypothetical protein
LKEKKKLKKRDLDKYPALNPRLNARTRYEVLDMDYLKDLSDAELKFLNKFMAEYVSGSFKKDVVGGYSDENFHKTPEERKECYTRNNVRNRCGLTIANATGHSIRSDDITALIDEVLSSSVVDDDKVEKLVIGIEDAGGYDNINDKIEDERYQDYLKLKNTDMTEEELVKFGKAYAAMLLELYDSDFEEEP